ncbi:MAG: hypothetical protein HRT46_07655 [Deltaproteobacteria bacterium]|nr:hypothetical protein [Deltaproteobacteria bacterium]
MDFSLSAEQEMVRSTAHSLFEGQCPAGLLQAAWDDKRAAAPLWDEHLYQWVELAGADLVDLVLFMGEHGRAAAPGVFFASLQAAQLAAPTGLAAEGSATVAVAGENGLWIPHDGNARHHVPSAGDADEMLWVAGSLAAPTMALVPTASATLTEVDQLDRLRPMYTVELAGPPRGIPVDPTAFAHAVDRALVTTAAELIGAGRWLLETSVEYACEREQFGQPIGSFQGLQWMLVDAAILLERADASVAYAAMCVDADDTDRHRAVHVAKAEAGLAARSVARTAMQVHAGTGYTFEHGLHFRLRRAYAGDAFMGPSGYHLDRLGQLLFSG